MTRVRETARAHQRAHSVRLASLQLPVVPLPIRVHHCAQPLGRVIGPLCQQLVHARRGALPNASALAEPKFATVRRAAGLSQHALAVPQILRKGPFIHIPITRLLCAFAVSHVPAPLPIVPPAVTVRHSTMAATQTALPRTFVRVPVAVRRPALATAAVRTPLPSVGEEVGGRQAADSCMFRPPSPTGQRHSVSQAAERQALPGAAQHLMPGSGAHCDPKARLTPPCPGHDTRSGKVHSEPGGCQGLACLVHDLELHVCRVRVRHLLHARCQAGGAAAGEAAGPLGGGGVPPLDTPSPSRLRSQRRGRRSMTPPLAAKGRKRRLQWRLRGAGAHPPLCCQLREGSGKVQRVQGAIGPGVLRSPPSPT